MTGGWDIGYEREKRGLPRRPESVDESAWYIDWGLCIKIDEIEIRAFNR